LKDYVYLCFNVACCWPTKGETLEKVLKQDFILEKIVFSTCAELLFEVDHQEHNTNSH